MQQVLNYIIESTLILGVFYLFYYFILRRETCFRFNRYYLLTSVVTALIIPFIQIPALVDTSTVASFGNFLLPEVITETTVDSLYTFPTMLVLAISIYLAGMIIAFIRFVVRLLVILRLVSRSRKEDYKGITIVKTDHQFPTFSFMNVLILADNHKLNEDDLEQVIEHEKIHIRQGHTYDILLIEILKIVFWFNPVFHGYKNALQQIHEYLADAAVIKDHNYGIYSKLLARQALVELEYSLGNHFNKSQILKRIQMMTNNQKPSRIKMWAVPVVFIMTIAIACQDGDYGQTKKEKLQLDNVDTRANNEVFLEVDVIPEFPGGKQGMFSHLVDNLKYPEEAKKNGIEGKVLVSFVIDEDGDVIDVEVKQGIGHGCDEEAKRIIASMPKWKPGEKDGKIVQTNLVLPITYKLK